MNVLRDRVPLLLIAVSGLGAAACNVPVEAGDHAIEDRPGELVVLGAAGGCVATTESTAGTLAVSARAISWVGTCRQAEIDALRVG